MSEMVFLRVYALHHVVKVGSWAFRQKIVDILPWPSMKEGRKVVDLLHNTCVKIYDAKKKAILEGTTDDEDFLSILGKRTDFVILLGSDLGYSQGKYGSIKA